jgi:2-methylcitrate dehydratase PrpD
MQASIKKWCVGSPIQSVLDAVTALVETHRIKADDAKRIIITMPDDRLHITNNRDMPDICVQHMASIMLLDGGITFESTHDHQRMNDPAVLAVRGRIELVPSPELSKAVPARQAIIEIETAGGERLRHHAKAVRGTPDNPMTPDEIDAKALDLVAPIIGPARAQDFVRAIAQLDSMRSVRALRPLLQA